MSEITITSNDNTYTIDPTNPASIEEALDIQYDEGYTDGQDDYDDTDAYDDGYKRGQDDAEPDHTEVRSKIDYFIFQINAGTTLADRTTVEVLKELAREIESGA